MPPVPAPGIEPGLPAWEGALARSNQRAPRSGSQDVARVWPWRVRPWICTIQSDAVPLVKNVGFHVTSTVIPLHHAMRDERLRRESCRSDVRTTFHGYPVDAALTFPAPPPSPVIEIQWPHGGRWEKTTPQHNSSQHGRDANSSSRQQQKYTRMERERLRDSCSLFCFVSGANKTFLSKFLMAVALSCS